MEQVNLRDPIAGPAFRDAVHIAIEPVVAPEILAPGTDVDRYGRSLDNPDSGEMVGIVNPFLTENVPKGAKFYIFIYPGTVTSIRHYWQHPAFKATVGELS